MSTSWIPNKEYTHWKHRAQSTIMVAILPNITEPRRGKWLIFHTHPASGGRFIMQTSESAKTMKKAREMAAVHLRHWENAAKWTTDPDYGKAN